MKAPILKLAASACAIILASCASTPKHDSRAQFLDEVNVSPALRGKTISDLYKKVYFAPVAVGHLKDQSWWSSQSSRTQGQLAADSRRLASYTHHAFEKAASNYPAKRLQVVNHPGPGTLVVETGITELVPAKAFWNSAASAAGFAVPGAGLLSTFGKGSITLEGHLRDGKTGDVLASFRKRSEDKMAVVNLNSYTWYKGSEANIDEVAAKTAETLNTSGGTKVKGSGPIKLIAF